MKAQSTASWPAIGGANRSHVPVILGPILEQQRQTATGPEAEQVAALADYALGIQTAINLEGKQPFEYTGIAIYDEGLQALAQTGSLHEDEQRCLDHFLQVLAHLRPHLIHYYDVVQIPRTASTSRGS